MTGVSPVRWPSIVTIAPDGAEVTTKARAAGVVLRGMDRTAGRAGAFAAGASAVPAASDGCGLARDADAASAGAAADAAGTETSVSDGCGASANAREDTGAGLDAPAFARTDS